MRMAEVVKAVCTLKADQRKPMRRLDRKSPLGGGLLR
jgi:hypothetical protein